MKSTKILSLMLVVVMCLGMLASCFEKDCVHVDANDDFKCDSCGVAFDDGYPKTYTYRTYTALSPSNWNELTYQDSNDTQIMSYIASSFFSYDFKFDENGDILPGEYVMKYDAVTKLEDVSATVDAKWGIPEGGTGYAYKFTLRDDLKWQNGDPITAADFVYSMEMLLAPEFQNYRADTVYNGSTVIVNAMEYAKQGQTILVDNYNTDKYGIADLVKGADGVYTQPDGKPVFFALTAGLGYLGGKSVTYYSEHLDATAFAALKDLANADGNVAITDESIALMTTLIFTENWGYETADYLPAYVLYENAYPALDFSEVGYYAASEYELVMILAQPLPLLDEAGELTYHVAYDLGSMPLVHKATYEKCKIEPSEGSSLWTSIYNSTVATTMSWGPYKLESFQSGKQYTLVRNENWYGYSLEENEGLYQTDRIVCDTIKEWNSAWTKFLAGEIDGIGIDVSVADDYKGSDRAYFTPDDYVASLQLQSSYDQLKARETEGTNKTILSYPEFRKALSLSINRADFATKTTTSSLAGFGLFNSMHYYDVANGGVYRNTDEAKKVLCDVYNVNPDDYDSLDAAVNSITGYDIVEARKLVDAAYDKALAAGDIKEGDVVTITMGTGAINETITRRYNYIRDAWLELVKGTKLADKLAFTDYYDGGDNWAKDFKAGKYDVCMGGWSGAAWNPGYFLAAYLLPVNMFSAAWDTASEMMEFTMPGVGENGEDITDTLSLQDWYYCLNSSSAKYDFTSNALTEAQRLPLIAALEKAVLQACYSVPLYNNFGASLISYKVDYVTYEYNTFMGYGGMKYMTYNFSDVEWNAEVAKQGGQLNYK